MKLQELKEIYRDNKNFQELDYKHLFGVEIYKSGRKHIKEEHVYYCYAPNDFDYWVYKNFIDELKDYEKKIISSFARLTTYLAMKYMAIITFVNWTIIEIKK